MKWQIISGWMEHVDMPLDFYQKRISMRCDSKSPIDLYSSEKNHFGLGHAACNINSILVA
jgi:hypothetical protein